MAAPISWAFRSLPTAIDKSSQVRSFTRFRGKQNYLDDYSGQQLFVTISNNNNQIADWPIGQAFQLDDGVGNDAQNFWVSEVQYNDAPGTNTSSGTNTNSTATVILDDWMTRAGRIQVTNFALTVENCFGQMSSQFTVASGALPSNMGWIAGFSDTDAAAATYTGTLAARINTNLKTEVVNGQLYQFGKDLSLRTAQISGSPVTNAITLKPLKGASTGDYYVLYQSFRRISAGQNFINTVTVEPPVVADQTASNATSVTTYGARFNSISTVNNTVLQALANATWAANCISNPNDLRYEVTFTDVMQDNNGIRSMFSNYTSGSFIYLEFVVPGSAVTTTEICAIEGIGYSATPSETTFTLYLTQMSVYAEFLLNSAVYGVLDENRLGVTF
jgi:hypothetical protein